MGIPTLLFSVTQCGELLTGTPDGSNGRRLRKSADKGSLEETYWSSASSADMACKLDFLQTGENHTGLEAQGPHSMKS